MLKVEQFLRPSFFFWSHERTWVEESCFWQPWHRLSGLEGTWRDHLLTSWSKAEKHPATNTTTSRPPAARLCYSYLWVVFCILILSLHSHTNL